MLPPTPPLTNPALSILYTHIAELDAEYKILTSPTYYKTKTRRETNRAIVKALLAIVNELKFTEDFS